MIYNKSLKGGKVLICKRITSPYSGLEYLELAGERDWLADSVFTPNTVGGDGSIFTLLGEPNVGDIQGPTNYTTYIPELSSELTTDDRTRIQFVDLTSFTDGSDVVDCFNSAGLCNLDNTSIFLDNIITGNDGSRVDRCVFYNETTPTPDTNQLNTLCLMIIPDDIYDRLFEYPYEGIERTYYDFHEGHLDPNSGIEDGGSENPPSEIPPSENPPSENPPSEGHQLTGTVLICGKTKSPYTGREYIKVRNYCNWLIRNVLSNDLYSEELGYRHMNILDFFGPDGPLESYIPELSTELSEEEKANLFFHYCYDGLSNGYNSKDALQYNETGIVTNNEDLKWSSLTTDPEDFSVSRFIGPSDDFGYITSVILPDDVYERIFSSPPTLDELPPSPEQFGEYPIHHFVTVDICKKVTSPSGKEYLEVTNRIERDAISYKTVTDYINEEATIFDFLGPEGPLTETSYIPELSTNLSEDDKNSIEIVENTYDLINRTNNTGILDPNISQNLNITTNHMIRSSIVGDFLPR